MTTAALLDHAHRTPARRARYLYAARERYQWAHAPGLPPHARSVPPEEIFPRATRRRMTYDIAETMSHLARSYVIRLFSNKPSIDSFHRYYPFERAPAVAERWTLDEEFGRQRLDGVNPLLLRLLTELPEKLPVTDELLRGLLPDGQSLARLLDARRLFVLDYEILDGIPGRLGRFCTAPIVLFRRDDADRLMPLAIQLGQSPADAPVIFTPKDFYWTWLFARSFVASAEGTHHEIVAHLSRTHLAMEPFWVAANRTLPPQHPLHELLKPHFSGTLDINRRARTKLLGPGGPIDQSIGIGAEGALDLIGRAESRWSFESTNPYRQIGDRGLLSNELLPGYHYRDDALRLFDLIETYVGELLSVFYPSDASVREDAELQSWVRELESPEGGRVRGLPTEDGALVSFETLKSVISQLIFTVSVEHSAVNNGQYAMFGWIPNCPGAMYLPPPTTKAPMSEEGLMYAFPDGRGIDHQLMLVHLLSQRTEHPLGTYPIDFFRGQPEVRAALGRFQYGLEELGRQIQGRNAKLEIPYEFLQPWLVARSITI